MKADSSPGILNKKVQVVRLIVKNSHYLYQEAKQLEKFILNLATRSFSWGVQDFFVAFLNEGNRTIRRAHKMRSSLIIFPIIDALADSSLLSTPPLNL